MATKVRDRQLTNPAGTGPFVVDSGNSEIEPDTGNTGLSFVVGSTSMEDIGPTGDVRMFFDKTNGSFRVGKVTGTEWDSASRGAYSFACGYNTRATGTAAFAEGKDTTASGNYSHAEGLGTLASNSQAHAEGYNTTASGANSHAEGYNTTASGVYSHAEGDSTFAGGYASHAEGLLTRIETTGLVASTTGHGSWSWMQGQRAHAGGPDPVGVTQIGDPQRSDLIARQLLGAGTGAQELFLDGTSGSKRVAFYTPAGGNPRDERTWGFRVAVVARRRVGTTVGDSMYREYTGLIKCIGGVTSQVGTTTQSIIAQDAGATGWVVTVSADAINDSLKITCQNPAGGGETRWAAFVTLYEVAEGTT